MVELQKRELKPLKIGLEPGEYRVTLENEGHVSRNERFEVREGVSRLGQSDLKLLVPSAVRVRGTNGLGAGVDALTMKLSFTKKLSSPSYHPDQRQLVNWDFNLLGNETYSISGLSLGALITHTQTDTRGAQIAGIYNRIEGDLQGVALAGLLNKIDGEVRNGLAVSGVSNVTSNLKNAAQISGALNYVGDLEKGAQVSGAVNIANHIENGSQISPVNIANDIKGTQIGLVNIARKLDGPAIGLFNLIGNGRHGISLRNNEINVPSLELKLGSKRTYTEFSIGQNWDDEIASFGLAFGVRMLNTSRHFFEADVGQIQLVKPQLCIVCDYETSKDSTDKSFMRVRLNLGQKVTKNLTLVGGLSINGSLGYWNDEFWAYQPIENFEEDYLSNALAVGKNGRTWVGYSYGLEFVF
jgi:hypothetical protein